MAQVIIYKDDSGRLAVVSPNLNCGLTVKQIARKDVPVGKSYKIIDASEIPTEASLRNAWTVDDAILTDGIGGMQ